jgi:hypothetical protein
MFSKVTEFNFKPSKDNGRFRVYSKQFNELVDELQSVFTAASTLALSSLTATTATITTLTSTTGNITTVNATTVDADNILVPVTTSALLGDAAGAINTANKSIGKLVFNTTDDTLYVATGVAAVDDWAPSDGGVAITPA